MTEPSMPILTPTACEWCSTGLYQRRLAAYVTSTTVLSATARLCTACVDLIGHGPRIALVPAAEMMPQLDPDTAAGYLGGQVWTPARSVPDYPHEYLLLSKSTDPPTHLRVVRLIRELGERRKWSPSSGPAAGRAVWCHYWRSGDYEHWTQPSRTDPILNRAER